MCKLYSVHALDHHAITQVYIMRLYDILLTFTAKYFVMFISPLFTEIMSKWGLALSVLKSTAATKVSGLYTAWTKYLWRRQTLNVASLLMFSRVYRLEILSVMLVFLTGFVNIAPLTFSLVSSPPPLPCVNKYTVYMYKVCKGGGGES